MNIAVQNFRGYLVTKSNYLLFSNYVNWSIYYTYGKEAVDLTYNGADIEVLEEILPITDEEYVMMEATIEQNITSIAAENLDVECYIYISPYNIYCFDYGNRTGQLERQFLAEKFYIEKLLAYDNYEEYCDEVYDFYMNYDYEALFE